MAEELLLIGEFSARCRLSAKALRRYDELGLLEPVRVDAASGYRWYAPEQVPLARRVALLRYLDIPLARIAEVLSLPAPVAVEAVRRFWTEQARLTSARASAAAYLSRRTVTGRSRSCGRWPGCPRRSEQRRAWATSRLAPNLGIRRLRST